ncbi:MAG TPA: hypothetical protein VK721_14160 [Solirubrobacteraceae bacterium]|nr:hypothetical protein [Solirubrobacteraceae bacterium]
MLLLLLFTATAMTLLVGVLPAVATSSIEGVWSFNGGQIAIQPEGDGKFEGIVVVPTKFAECTHVVGEQIWTEITQQPDGSYWGLHQWFLGPCERNPARGPTAWRVLQEPNGASYLKVCFSHPGTSQPTIAANGTAAGDTYGCDDSALTAALPGSSGTAADHERLTLPSAKKCLSLRVFKIHLLDPRYDPLKTVTITLKGRKITTSRKGKYIVATIDLKGLPRAAFTVKIHATTILGHHLSASRTYHTCVKKIVTNSGRKKSGSKG